jgi:catechol 2,3-dioxygenase-like lactoylglutathione lyase family enzyme
MLDHLSIPVADIVRSRRFYEAALAPLGYVVRKDFGEAVGFGVVDGHGRALDPGGDFWIFRRGIDDGRQPTHFAFSAASRAVVAAFHVAALAAGGLDNGPPGLRPKYHPDYYAAFVVDPDGYNIEAVCHRSTDAAAGAGGGRGDRGAVNCP